MIDSKEFSSCKLCDSEVELVNPVFKLVKCKKCELVFAQTIFAEQEFIETYRNLYNGDVKRTYSRHSSKEYNDLLKGEVNIGYNRKRMIQKYLKKESSVAEIGSGIGLIGTFLKRYPKIEYVGLELDFETHEKAISLGINSVHGDFSQLENLPSDIDTIMMWEVFEHLQDLKLFFELANKKLKVGGAIFLSVPNYDKRLNYDQSGNNKYKLYQDIPPIHLNFYTRKTLKNIFEANKFKIEVLEMKRFPYINLKQKSFYINFVKAIFHKYNGSTLYLKAVKVM